MRRLRSPAISRDHNDWRPHPALEDFMTEPTYDIVIREGRVATACDVFDADVAITGESVAAIGRGLPAGRREIDARGKLVLPGGVDSHAHIEQLSAAGIMNADTFESATTSAAFGGTTTVISFAAQHVGMKLPQVLSDYHALARQGAVIDYAFHMIIADPTPETLANDIPALVKEGHASIKIFMTYDRLKIDDEPLLDILVAARESGAMLCAHAENHGIIAWMTKRLLARGYSDPKYHAISHARFSEADAFNRLIGMAALVDQPIMIFHVSTAEGAKVIRDARGEGLKVFAETCPQYLFLTAEDLNRQGVEGAKWMCSPPPRSAADQEALWNALARGDLQTISSDHAPYRFDETGKLRAGPRPNFKQVANGLPGLEVRLPLLFDAMVSKGRLGLEKFVELTATAPAKIYNLHRRKGSIAVGADADIAIWDPAREVTLSNEMMHDLAGYTPYAGRKIRGWPITVLSRGRVVVADGRRRAEPGSGRFLARTGGEAARPTGRLVADMDPERNFGATLL
jgi:dihydropyrimidinase